MQSASFTKVAVEVTNHFWNLIFNLKGIDQVTTPEEIQFL